MSDQTPKRRIQRILVAVDTSQPSRAALQAAVDLARELEGELTGVFVEDENLLRMAGISFTREVRQFSPGTSNCTAKDIERQLRVRARQAEELVGRIAEQAGVPFSFRVIRGQVNKALIAAAGESDLITLGRAGHSKASHRQLGSTAETILRQASRSVMVLEGGVRLHPPIVVIYDGSETSEKALEIAGQLTGVTEYEAVTVVIFDPSGTAARDLEERALSTLRQFEVPASFQATETFTTRQLVHVIESLRSGLVLAPASLLETYPEETQRVLTNIVTPILFVR